MADSPKLRAFITAVTFADGSTHLSAMVMPDEMSAMTTSGVEAGRRFQGPSVGYAYVEMPAEALRAALRQVESGKASGEVVSLVRDSSPNIGQEAAFAAAVQRSGPWYPAGLCCPSHPDAPLLNGCCPICQPTGGAA